LAHLATDVRGVLVDNAPALALAGSLHPTAAVCGTPKSRARVLIGELEQMERGRYAGPIGWFDASGNGEFGIALRCAQLQSNTARLFAGAGIVAGSDPASELKEIETKFSAVTSCLN
jgi:menaquinone-specific isochorismate synthase